MRTTLLILFLAPILVIALAGCDSGSSPEQPSAPSQHWYEGGTLPKAHVSEWWRASHANKLATCADFVASVWEHGHLNPAISAKLHSVDDLRPLAEELVTYLDTATKQDTLSEEAKKLIENSELSQLAALGMVQMGWTQP